MVQQTKRFHSSLLPFIAAKSIGTILRSDSNASIGVDFIALKKISIKALLSSLRLFQKSIMPICVYTACPQMMLPYSCWMNKWFENLDCKVWLHVWLETVVIYFTPFYISWLFLMWGAKVRSSSMIMPSTCWWVICISGGTFLIAFSECFCIPTALTFFIYVIFSLFPLQEDRYTIVLHIQIVWTIKSIMTRNQ